MKDFAHSYDQRAWSLACESHARAMRCLQGIEGRSGMEKYVAFWTKVKQDAERRFPALCKKLA